jgi:hypothetical protein
VLDEDAETTIRPWRMMADHSYSFKWAVSSSVQAAALASRDARHPVGGRGGVSRPSSTTCVSLSGQSGCLPASPGLGMLPGTI